MTRADVTKVWSQPVHRAGVVLAVLGMWSLSGWQLARCAAGSMPPAGLVGTGLGLFCGVLAVVGAHTAGHEFENGSVNLAVLAAGGRLRHVVATAVAVSGFSAACAVLGLTGAMTVGAVCADVPFDRGAAVCIAGGTLVSAGAALLGVGTGLLLRSSTAAVCAVLTFLWLPRLLVEEAGNDTAWLASPALFLPWVRAAGDGLVLLADGAVLTVVAAVVLAAGAWRFVTTRLPR